jgi:hypothetical protein
MMILTIVVLGKWDQVRHVLSVITKGILKFKYVLLRTTALTKFTKCWVGFVVFLRQKTVNSIFFSGGSVGGMSSCC